MPTTIRSQRQVHLLDLLIGARRRAGLTQAIPAARLGGAQSSVAKDENGERRIDVVELAEALGEEPALLFDRLMKGV